MGIDILLVEDSRADAELIKEALRDTKLGHSLHVETNGEDALEYLQNVGHLPHLILLDLNLPRMGGLDLLKEIRHDPHLRPTPVIILTNSSSQDDIARCYENFCNAYVRKPLSFEDLTDVVEKIEAFWFRSASLPRNVFFSEPPDLDGE